MTRLLLVGGGHAHVQVLAALARVPLAAAQVTLLSPEARPIYSGMLPGWITGDYALEQCTLKLDALAHRAAARFIQSRCSGLDLAAREVHCDNGENIPFDYLSINTGAAGSDLAGAGEHGLPLRPLAGFVAAWPALLERLQRRRDAFMLAIVGAGAAAVELALAMQSRFAAAGLHHVRLALIGGDDEALPGFPATLRRRVAQLLVARGVRHLGGRRVAAVLPGQLLLADGSRLAADLALLATGAEAPPWPAASGLATDAAGFIRVNPCLQSLSHAFVFAAGDIATHPAVRPKSGVFAVRAGPPLAANLRAIVAGQALQPWSPQQRALYLLGIGQRQALAAWGGFSAGGSWAWRWKDRIDRRFMARFGG